MFLVLCAHAQCNFYGGGRDEHPVYISIKQKEGKLQHPVAGGGGAGGMYTYVFGRGGK